jgi:hypothetical protein
LAAALAKLKGKQPVENVVHEPAAAKPIEVVPTMTPPQPSVRLIEPTNEIVVEAQTRKSDKETMITVKSADVPSTPAPNSKTLTGALEQFRKSWRLRYADVGQEDVFGGVVVLEGGDLSQLKEGRHARITGVLVPPESRTATAVCRVKSIEILD